MKGKIAGGVAAIAMAGAALLSGGATANAGQPVAPVSADTDAKRPCGYSAEGKWSYFRNCKDYDVTAEVVRAGPLPNGHPCVQAGATWATDDSSVTDIRQEKKGC
ncbi:DUF6355 family natural product biosynthesis protein [Amycolatopsis nigrescens]|uniref:DUF6355 family natural product biosynthesis protein n=1 Tax=Amycolatopsis nigrescens TaxID=381445 RepID=UPI0003795C60|nr:DUF6355 family natural product biosynthesis protein [Amycolatopsis nigrescens]